MNIYKLATNCDRIFNMMRFLFILILPVLLLSGCSFFVSSRQDVTINTAPKDTRVLVDGEWYHAPVRIQKKRNRKLAITIAKEGYETQSVNVDYHLNDIGILDIVGGGIFLIPFIGLLHGGAYELDQSNFYFELSPLQKQ